MDIAIMVLFAHHEPEHIALSVCIYYILLQQHNETISLYMNELMHKKKNIHWTK